MLCSYLLLHNVISYFILFSPPSVLLCHTMCHGPTAAWTESEPDHTALYRESMRVFCAMEDGTAFGSDFVWDETISDM